MKTLPNRLFYVIVLTTSTMLINLSKNMKVATLGEAPSIIVPISEESRVDSINAMQIDIDR